MLAEFSGYDFASGVLGAAVAETVAELFSEIAAPKEDDLDRSFLEDCFDAAQTKQDELGRKLTAKEYNAVCVGVAGAQHESLKRRACFVGKLGAIATAFSAGQDVGGAAFAAKNAVENNFIAAPLPLAGQVLGLSAGASLHSIHDILEGLQAFGEYLGERVHATALYLRFINDAAFRTHFLSWANDAQGHECARPDDNVDTHQPGLNHPGVDNKLPGFMAHEEERQVLATPKPDEKKPEAAGLPIPDERDVQGMQVLTKKEVDENSRVRPVNGRMPRNHQYAGQVYPVEKLPLDLQKKFPHSVPFTGSGFPDFTRYAKKKVRIKVTGDHYQDTKLANEVAGYKKEPEGYTWHHHHDGETMMLVDFELHQFVKHTGGAAIVKGTKK